MIDLNWRYATKGFDPNVRIKDSDIKDLVEAVRLAPTSFGLQPFKIIVIADQETKSKLRAASFGQAQITDCSHLFVFCVHTDVSEQQVDHYMDLISETREISKESLSAYKERIAGFVNGMAAEGKLDWAKRQAYLALGFLLYACAEKKIDACPMEGFIADSYDEILDLKQQGLTTCVLASVGYRTKEDKGQYAAKVRKPETQFADYR